MKYGKMSLPIMLFIISLLMVCNIQIAGIGIYVVLLFVCSFVALIMHVADGMEHTIVRIGRKEQGVIALLIILPWEIFRLVYKIILSFSVSEMSFENQLVIISVIVLLLAFREYEGIGSYEFERLGLVGIPILVINAISLVTGNESIAHLIPLYSQNDEMAAYIVFFVMLLGLELEKTNGKFLRYIYIGALGIGYAELVLTMDWFSIFILILYYLSIPIYRLPTKSLISLYMKQLFAFVFMISNISLITGYTGLLAKKVDLPLEASIYIDIILAVCGLIFFTYWEKVPEKVDPDRLILKKMRTGFKIAALTFLCLLLAIIIGADRLIVAADSDIGGIKLVLSIIASSMKSRGNILTNMIADGDVIGFLLIILIVSMLVYKAVKNISLYKPRTSSYALIACVFVVMLLTMEVNANIAVIGGFILMVAAYGEEPRQKYTIRRFDFDTDIENDYRGSEEQNELSIEEN